MRFSAIPVFLSLLLCACTNDSSPTKPTVGSQDITGRLSTYSTSEYEIEITLHRKDQDTTYITSTNTAGEFAFENIPPGVYTLTASKDNCIFSPEEITVTVAYDPIEITGWFGLDTTFSDDDECYLIVSIEPDNGPLWGFKILNKTTYNDGICSFKIKTGETFDITPHKPGYEYEYTPPSATITADKKLIVQRFSARYIGPPLHTVSGQFHYSDGIPHSNWYIKLRTEHISLWTILGEDGYFSFTGLVDGTYIVKNSDSRFVFEPASIEVTVHGNDVVIDEQFVFVEYTGGTDYTIRGAVIDQKGNGVAGVNLQGIRVSPTDENGEYSGLAPGRNQNIECTVTPEKEGYFFEPPNYTFTAYYQEGVWHGGIIEIPDFIATDYTVYHSDSYFTSGTGASWTYDRRDTESGDDEYTMTIDGAETAGDFAYSRFTTSGPGGMTLLRIDGEDVHAWDGDEDIVMLRFSVVPGTEWASGTDSAGYKRTGVFHGLEEVTVPAGTFTDCLRYESRLNYGETTYEAHEMWFAEDIGLVRQVRTLVNYGEEIERTELELVE